MSTNKSKQIAKAIPIYKKDAPKEPENIVGIKIFPLDPSSDSPRCDFNADAMIIWRREIKALLLAGVSAPVIESKPFKRT